LGTRWARFLLKVCAFVHIVTDLSVFGLLVKDAMGNADVGACCPFLHILSNFGGFYLV